MLHGGRTMIEYDVPTSPNTTMLSVAVNSTEYKIVEGIKYVNSDIDTRMIAAIEINAIFNEVASRPAMMTDILTWTEYKRVNQYDYGELRDAIVVSLNGIYRETGAYTDLYSRQLAAFNGGEWSLEMLTTSAESPTSIVPEYVSEVERNVLDLRDQIDTFRELVRAQVVAIADVIDVEVIVPDEPLVAFDIATNTNYNREDASSNTTPITIIEDGEESSLVITAPVTPTYPTVPSIVPDPRHDAIIDNANEDDNDSNPPVVIDVDVDDDTLLSVGGPSTVVVEDEDDVSPNAPLPEEPEIEDTRVAVGDRESATQDLYGRGFPTEMTELVIYNRADVEALDRTIFDVVVNPAEPKAATSELQSYRVLVYVTHKTALDNEGNPARLATGFTEYVYAIDTTLSTDGERDGYPVLSLSSITETHWAGAYNYHVDSVSASRELVLVEPKVGNALSSYIHEQIKEVLGIPYVILKHIKHVETGILGAGLTIDNVGETVFDTLLIRYICTFPFYQSNDLEWFLYAKWFYTRDDGSAFTEPPPVGGSGGSGISILEQLEDSHNTFRTLWTIAKNKLSSDRTYLFGDWHVTTRPVDVSRHSRYLEFDMVLDPAEPQAGTNDVTVTLTHKRTGIEDVEVFSETVTDSGYIDQAPSEPNTGPGPYSEEIAATGNVITPSNVQQSVIASSILKVFFMSDTLQASGAAYDHAITDTMMNVLWENEDAYRVRDGVVSEVYDNRYCVTIMANWIVENQLFRDYNFTQPIKRSTSALRYNEFVSPYTKAMAIVNSTTDWWSSSYLPVLNTKGGNWTSSSANYSTRLTATIPYNWKTASVPTESLAVHDGDMRNISLPDGYRITRTDPRHRKIAFAEETYRLQIDIEHIATKRKARLSTKETAVVVEPFYQYVDPEWDDWEMRNRTGKHPQMGIRSANCINSSFKPIVFSEAPRAVTTVDQSYEVTATFEHCKSGITKTKTFTETILKEGDQLFAEEDVLWSAADISAMTGDEVGYDYVQYHLGVNPGAKFINIPAFRGAKYNSNIGPDPFDWMNTPSQYLDIGVSQNQIGHASEYYSQEGVELPYAELEAFKAWDAAFEAKDSRNALDEQIISNKRKFLVSMAVNYDNFSDVAARALTQLQSAEDSYIPLTHYGFVTTALPETYTVYGKDDVGVFMRVPVRVADHVFAYESHNDLNNPVYTTRTINWELGVELTAANQVSITGAIGAKLSDERERNLSILYSEVLGREPDVGGLAHWMSHDYENISDYAMAFENARDNYADYAKAVAAYNMAGAPGVGTDEFNTMITRIVNSETIAREAYTSTEQYISGYEQIVRYITVKYTTTLTKRYLDLSNSTIENF